MRLLIGSCFLFLLCAAAALAVTLHTPAGSVVVAPQSSTPPPKPPADPDVSWGKADVAYDAYNYDRLYCGSYGFVYAMKAPSWAMSGHHTLGDIIDKDFSNPQLRQSGQEEVEHCLRLRGYSKFHLTQDQVAHLQSLNFGSKEREKYLYSLASDPVVMDRQKF